MPGVRRLDGFSLMLMQAQHRAVKAIILEAEDISHSGWSSRSATRSVIVPPEAKFGLSDSHGSGHWYPRAIRSATRSEMVLSWMSTKLPVNSR